MIRFKGKALRLSFEVLEDLGHVAHDALPVGALNLAHLGDVLMEETSNLIIFMDLRV